MRSRCYFSVTASLPSNVSPRFALEVLQTYIPTISQMPGVIGFIEIPAEPALIADDPYFGPWDETVRAYTIRAAIHMLPGLTKTHQWPAVFQKTPNGMRNRGNTPTGIVTWTEWTVRRCGDGADAGAEIPNTTVVDETEQWEIHVDNTVEARSLLMPFVQRYSDRAMAILCQRVADEIIRFYLQTPI